MGDVGDITLAKFTSKDLLLNQFLRGRSEGPGHLEAIASRAIRTYNHWGDSKCANHHATVSQVDNELRHLNKADTNNNRTIYCLAYFAVSGHEHNTENLYYYEARYTLTLHFHSHVSFVQTYIGKHFPQLLRTKANQGRVLRSVFALTELLPVLTCHYQVQHCCLPTIRHRGLPFKMYEGKVLGKRKTECTRNSYCGWQKTYNGIKVEA